MSLSYRTSQLWWNLTAKPLSGHKRTEIQSFLSPAQCELFFRFLETDQWHAYRVYTTLQDAEENQADLLVAALLHDIGKTKVNLTVWDRIMIVIIERILPQKAQEWGQGAVDSWKRPFVVRQQHPQWGAEMARAARTSELAVELIARHQDPLPENTKLYADELLRKLQWADDLN